MKSREIPILTLPTSDYESMLTWSNRHLISVLRQAVLAPERVARFSPRPPAEHDAYMIMHQSMSISIRLMREGKEVFRCCFVPAEDY